LIESLGFKLRNAEKPDVPLWQRMPNFKGSVDFLEARPTEDPGINLDIVTCHHGEYYREAPGYENAPDIEEPVPVIFPAVAPGKIFYFPIVGNRRSSLSDLTTARDWLSCGITGFGVGAKTNAGYGWFTDLTAQEREKEKAAQEAIAEAEARASVHADSKIAADLRAIPKDQLRGILNKFEFDQEKFWPHQEPESTHEFQVTLLELHLEDSALLEAAMGVKRAKKALQNLAKKFNRSLP
jgi:CRISPR-associated protein Cmr6